MAFSECPIVYRLPEVVMMEKGRKALAVKVAGKSPILRNGAPAREPLWVQ